VSPSTTANLLRPLISFDNQTNFEWHYYIITHCFHLWIQSKTKFHKNRWQLVSSILNLLIINGFGAVYSYISRSLTDFENHRTQTFVKLHSNIIILLT
jgi:hypothetical protein